MELRKINIIRQIVYCYRELLSKRSYSIGRNNKKQFQGVRIHNKIQVSGNNNIIMAAKMSVLKNVLIRIQGNGNSVFIEEGAYLSGAELWLEGDSCRIRIGKNSFVGGKTHLACTEQTEISIGCECMLSSNIQIRTGDSHSIVEMDGNRINPAESVEIGNHCWIGEGAKVMKGVTLEGDDVVSTGAIVTKSFGKNVLLGGIPAKVIKENVTWDKERI